MPQVVAPDSRRDRMGIRLRANPCRKQSMPHAPIPGADNQSEVASARKTRRDFLMRAGGGLGAIALASLLQGERGAAVHGAEAKARVPLDPLAPRRPHFA